MVIWMCLSHIISRNYQPTVTNTICVYEKQEKSGALGLLFHIVAKIKVVGNNLYKYIR